MKLNSFKIFKAHKINVFIYTISITVSFLVGLMVCNSTFILVDFLENQKGDILIGLLTGIISSIITSEIYRHNDKKKSTIIKFNDNKQEYSKYLDFIKTEISIFRSNKNKSKNYLLRALSEPHWYNGFNHKTLTEEDRKTLEDTSNLLQNFRNYLDTTSINEITDIKMHIFEVKMFKCQLNILKMKISQ